MARTAEAPVWPRPRQIRFAPRRLTLAPPLGLTVEGSAPWLKSAARQAAQVINQAAGKRVVSATGRGTGPRLLVTDMDSLPKGRGLQAVRKAEGYALSVTPRGVMLSGRDARGVFYGAQTLADLINRDETPSLPAVKIRDWPRFAMRGAHMFLPPREQIDFFCRFLDMMARYKLNTLVLEISGGMEYKRHPEINRAWKKFCRDALAYDFDQDHDSPGLRSDQHFHPMFSRTGPVALQVSRYFRKNSAHVELAGGEWLTTDEMRRIVRECRKRHIEIIPEVQSLSHAYYLCCAHPEIAEHDDDPWPDTYCPSNPKSYELLFDIMDEVIEMFRPRIVHIGHDEYYSIGHCPRCKGKNAHKLFADDVNRIRAFLAGRGIRTMLWGDKLMKCVLPDGKRHGGSAKRQKDPGTGKWWIQPPTWESADMIADDVIICDWFWGLDRESERNFRKHGFETFYGNFSPLRFDNWERRSNVPYVHGAEMSTWCEVSAKEFGHNNTFYQFFPGADMLWTGRQMERDQVTALMARRLTPLLDYVTGRERWLASGGAGRIAPVDICAIARPLPRSLRRRLRTGKRISTVLGTGDFNLLADAGDMLERSIVLDVANPKSGAIPVERKLKRLVLLQGSTLEDVFFKATYYTYAHGPSIVARCRVRYADGKQAVFPIIYGEDVGPVRGAWPGSGSGYCYRAVPVDVGDRHTLFAMEWENPRPKVAVRSINITLGPHATDKGALVIPAVSVVV